MPGMSPNARTSAAYWKRRTELEEARAYRTAEQAAKEMRRYYRAQYLRTAKQMENLYAEVQRQGTLSRTKLWQYRQWREMEADLAKFCDAGAMIERDRIRQCLDKVFADVIEKPVEFFDPSQYVIRMSPEAVINTAWSGENYSERVWKNRTELAEHLRMDMEEMIGQGTSIGEITRRVQKDFNVSYGRAEALVKTEASYVFNQATLARYEASGIEKVRYITERDSRVCESCAGYDDMVFYLEDAPRLPLHPRCRCRYAPVIERPGEEVPVDGQLEEGDTTAAETLEKSAPESAQPAAQALPSGADSGIMDTRTWYERTIAGNPEMEEKYKTALVRTKEKGIMDGEYQEPRIPDNFDSFTFNDEHANSERHHNVTEEEARRFVKEAVIMIKRNNGAYLNYYGTAGSAYILARHNEIKTAFKPPYSPNIERLLEVFMDELRS